MAAERAVGRVRTPGDRKTSDSSGNGSMATRVLVALLGIVTVLTTALQSVPASAAPPYAWVSLSGDVSPTRYGAAMTQDGTVSPAQVLLFGGQASSSAQSDTWRWNGTSWSKLSPAASPTARTAAAAVYDPLHNQVLLFGGTAGSSVLSDTWTWNGTTWTKLSPATSPAARSAAAMAWDPVHQVVVLFGGATKNSTLQDTWTWNGTTWTQQSPATKPSNRSGAAVAWDSASASLILFGGASGQTKLGDTWRWNGTTWAQLSMATSPSARTGAAAALDSASGAVTLFGGVGSSEDADTWTFNQTTWTALAPATSPSARDAAGIAVAADGSLLLVDGRSGSTQVSGTWSWQTVPGAPTGVSATGQNAQAAVQWTAPPSGGQAITSYTVTASPGGATATSTTTSATVTGLQPATSYTFTVTASNGLGIGVASSPSSAATTWSVPGAPTGVSATAGNGQANVSWTAPASNGGSAITGYTVTPYIGSTAQAPTSAAASATSAIVSGLSNGTAYTFQVTAANVVGSSAPGTSGSVTPVGAPSAPTGVTATPGNAQAIVSWSAPASNGGSAITGYTVTPYAGSTAGTATNVGAGITSTSITGLSNGTAYTFQVTASNTVGTSVPATSAAITPVGPPSAPVNVTATPGSLQATVSWSAPTSNGGGSISGYTVTPFAGGSAMSPTVVSGSTLSTTITGLSNGTTYTFQVAATNAAGTGPVATSNAVLLGLPGAPSSVAATAGTNQASVTWSPPTDGSAPGVVAYQVTAVASGVPGASTATNASAGSATLTGLAGGVSYTVQVSARNQYGWGPAGASGTVVPGGTASTYASSVLADAPAAYYRLDEASGSYAADSSGNGNVALYNQDVHWGGGQTPGGASGALANDPDRAASVFTGNLNGANILDSSGNALPHGTSPRTWEGWFQTGSGGTLAATTPGSSFRLRVAGAYWIQVITPSTSLTWTTPYPITDGAWHMVDAAWDGTGSMTVYLDGSSLGTRTGAGAAGTATGISVSGDEWDGGDQLPGSVDEVALYDAALTAARVSAHFAASGNGTPLPPANVTATPGTNQVSVSWSATSAGVPAGAAQVTRYQVTAYAGSVARNVMYAASSATSLTMTGLQGGVAYAVQVVPVNEFGLGGTASSTTVVPSGAPSTYASTVLNDTPAAYYRLDDPFGLAADSSGNGNMGIYNQDVHWGGGESPSGASSALANDGDRGAGVYTGNLNGADIGVLTGVNLPQGSSARTWEGWFLTSGGGTLAATNGSTFRVRVSGTYWIQVVTPATTLTWTAPYVVTDGAWHMLDAVYDGAGAVTLYLDGSSLGTQSGAGTAGSVSALTLSGDVGGGDQLTGAVDEIALYDAALSAGQVSSHFVASGATTPAAPASVTATAGTNSATVSWSAATANVPPGEPQVSMYQVTAYAGSTARNVMLVSGSTTSATVSGLQGGVSYTIQVTGIDEFGRGAPASSNPVVPTGPATTYAATVLGDGPAAYYRFDENIGIAADSSGNSNLGLYNQNVNWGGGQNPSGASGALANDGDPAASVHTGNLNGADIGVLVANHMPQGSGARSWEAWFRTPSGGTVAALAGSTFRLRVSGQYWIQVITPSATLSWPTPYLITDNNWHMADAVYDGTGSVTVYLDGANLGTRTGAGAAATATGLTMSGDLNGADQLVGAVDEISLYDAALSATQVSAHFAAAGGTTPVAPSTVSATPGANQATVSWSATTAAVPAGAAPVSLYQVTAFAAGVPQTVLLAGSGATSATMTGLQGGVSYTFQVLGRNQFGAGSGTFSGAVTPTGAATTYASTILGDAPAAYYRLDDVTGYAADSSGNGDIALYNQNVNWGGGQTPSGSAGALVNDPDPAASVFTGNANGADIAAPAAAGMPQGSGARTWEGWFKTGSGGTVAALAGSTFRLRVSGQYALQVVTPATTLTWATPYPVTDNTWHLVEAAYDGTGGVTVYLDGSSVGTQTGAGTAGTATGLAMAGDVNGADQLVGAVDEIALYDSVLSGTQVAAHFAASGDTRPTPPGVPTNVVASGGDTRATVAWSPPASSGTGPVTSYTVTPYLGSTAQTSTTVGASTLSVTFTGLTDNVTYTFQVVATSVYGSSVPATSNPVMPAVLPGPPTNVVATAADGRATVHWGTPAAPGNTVNKYTVTPYAGTTAQTPVVITPTAGSGLLTTASFGGLSDGTAYTFQVTAANDTGTGPVATSAAVTPAVPAPLAVAPAKGYDAGATPAMVAIGGLTGNGWRDLVTANGGSNTVSALLNQVKGSGHLGGTFAQPAMQSSAGGAASQVALGDFNGDGKLDAAVVNGSGVVEILLGNGDGTFAAPVATPALNGQSANLIAVADMNGDGRADLVVAGNISAYPYGTAVDVLLGNGDGTFQAPVQHLLHDVCLGCAYWASGLAVGDFNGDGLPDVAYSNDNTSHGWDSGNVYALLNTGGGTLSDPTYTVEIPGPHSAVAGGELAVADLNGDGIPDIVALEDATYVDLNGSGGQRGISISFGQGGGGFAPPVYVADHALVGSSNSQDFGDAEALAIADMNGDGQPDVVTADARGGSSGFSVYLNAGGGSIDAPQLLGTGGFVPRGIALADVNGDGEPDVVLENGGATGAANIEVLLNGTDFPPLGGALGPGEMHGCAMCQAMRGGGALVIDGTHPITVNSGEMSHTFTDISIPARGLPLTVTQTYNDMAASADAGLGYGWWSPILMSVASDPSTGRTTVTQEDGGQAQFFTATLQPVAPRTQATLAHNGDGTWTFTRYKGDVFTFNAAGQITSLANRNGDVLSFGYTAGHVSSMSHSDGRSLALAWSSGHLGSITDANVAGTTRVVSFTYDAAGELTDIDWTVNGGGDRNEHFEYESAPWPHGMTGMRDPRGIWVTQVYDASGRTTSQTIDPTSKDSTGLNRTTTYGYTVSGGMVTQALITDPVGNQVLDTFAYGELVQKVAGYGTAAAATWTYSYDPTSVGTRMATDPNGHTSSAAFDALGNLLASTDAAGDTTSSTYSGNGGADGLNYQPTSTTDPNGITTQYTYDTVHRTLTQVSRPLVGSSPAVSQVEQYLHGDASHPGDLTGYVDPAQKTWSYGYDAHGDQTSSTDPVGDRTASTYNADGWLLTTVSAKGDPSVCTAPCSPAQYTTTYGYADGSGSVNFLGTPTMTTDPLGHQAVRVYDADYNVVQVTDGNGNVTTYDYDNAGEQTVTHRADAGHSTTQTQYNADGTVLAEIDGKGNTLLSYGYDSLGRPVSVTVDPGSSPHLNQATVYTYDAAGNMLSKQDPGGSCTGTLTGCTTYSYDAVGRRTGVSYSDGQTPNVSGIQYDADGHRLAMTDGTGQWSWQYDSLNRLTSVTEGRNGTVSYQYDLRGMVTQVTYPTSGETVTRGYDDAGRWTSVRDWNSASTTFRYDADSRLVETDMASGTTLRDTATYDNADQLTAIAASGGAGSVFAASYGRDANGQVASDSSAANGQTSYQYTPLNQVCYAGSTSAAFCATPPAGAQPFGYDAADNPVTVGSTAQTFNTADQVTASGGTTFGYDSRGNRVSATAGGTTTSYGYDQAGNLCWAGTTVSGAACSSAAQSGDTVYCSNGNGLRMSKVTAGACATPTTSEPFVWDMSGGIPQLISDGNTAYVTGPGGLVLEQITGSTTLWYHHDQLGSTRAVTDSSGTVHASYTFDPFGNQTASTGSVANPFLFAGQYRDSETGLYYLRARCYDPVTAQFLSRDPLLEQTRTPYGYATENPLNRVDPSGLDTINTLPAGYTGPTVNCAMIDSSGMNNYILMNPDKLSDSDRCTQAFPIHWTTPQSSLDECAAGCYGSNGMATGGAVYGADVNMGQYTPDPLRRDQETPWQLSVGFECFTFVVGLFLGPAGWSHDAIEIYHAAEVVMGGLEFGPKIWSH
jgi:RHS repeat-associated protein